MLKIVFRGMESCSTVAMGNLGIDFWMESDVTGNLQYGDDVTGNFFVYISDKTKKMADDSDGCYRIPGRSAIP